MISEHQLAQRGSFWAVVAPMLEPFIRVINRDSLRFGHAVPFVASSDDRAVVSECAFELARRMVCGGGKLSINEVAVAVHEKLAALDSARNNPSETVRAAVLASVEIRAIADNLGRLISWLGGNAEFGPEFPGCGYVSSCVGDMLVGTCLVEIKAVNRGFRSEHLRQLITYLALNSTAHSHVIDRVALANPRDGMAYVIPVETLFHRIAGMSDKEFIERFAFLVSGAEMSR